MLPGFWFDFATKALKLTLGPFWIALILDENTVASNMQQIINRSTLPMACEICMLWIC